MLQVEEAFINRFGPYAGWAHNVLFISDLASSRQYLPENLRTGSGGVKKIKMDRQEDDAGIKEESELVKLEGLTKLRD